MQRFNKTVDHVPVYRLNKSYPNPTNSSKSNENLPYRLAASDKNMTTVMAAMMMIMMMMMMMNGNGSSSSARQLLLIGYLRIFDVVVKVE